MAGYVRERERESVCVCVCVCVCVRVRTCTLCWYVKLFKWEQVSASNKQVSKCVYLYVCDSVCECLLQLHTFWSAITACNKGIYIPLLSLKEDWNFT